LSRHRRTPTPEIEIAARFGKELDEFRRSENVSVNRIAEINYCSPQRIYKAWCKTELASWPLVQDVINAICEHRKYPEDKEQATLELWREKHSVARSEIEAARNAVESRFTEVIEQLARLAARVDGLEQVLQPLAARLDDLERDRRPPSDPDATLHFGTVPGHAVPLRHGEPEPDHRALLEEVRRYITLTEQEAERLRQESRQAELRAQELALHAQQAEVRAQELHRYLAEIQPRPERRALPGQRGWQE
jgi:DNA repair exonuclease SbcCD ATPase subunit